MKSPILVVFLCLHVFCFGQLNFEEITSPNDFSIWEIRKSQTGEYFTQAANDDESIYTSMNGQDWINTPLPENVRLDGIQFYSDGTPVLQPDSYEHLIRRNGVWYSMNFTGGFSDVEATFIKGDTLFAFQDQSFAYSLDKGESFTTIFTATDNIVDHTAHLWKFDNHFILHHTAGASDDLSIYNMNGDLISNQGLNISGVTSFVYNSCGQVLLYDYDYYYLLSDQSLNLEQGNIEEITPDNSPYIDNIFSQDGNYYVTDGSNLFKTNGCSFVWEVLVNNALIEFNERIWLYDQEGIILYNPFKDSFIEQIGGTNTWEEKNMSINYSYLIDVDESFQQNQIALTYNGLFTKDVDDTIWIESDSVASNRFQIQYSPDGDLYIYRGDDILYSEDNGLNYTIIEIPNIAQTHQMEVLDDDVIILLWPTTGDGIYTINNGQDWIAINVSFSIGYPHIKFVNNTIIIADLDYDYKVTRINTTNNEIIEEELGVFFNNNYFGSAMLDDGTMYFLGQDANENNPEGLYRFSFGGGLEFIGEFPELAFLFYMESAGNDLIVFGSDEYYLFDGSTLFTSHIYTGLPDNDFREYLISENGYLYVKIENHRVFRSTEPFLYPQFINGSVYSDSNLDCILDTQDGTLNYWQVKVENDNFIRIRSTDDNGHFNISVPEGDFTISSQPVNPFWDLCESSYNVTIDENNTEVNQDFQANPLVECAGLELDFSTPLLRRCFDNYYSVIVRNTGPIESDGTTLTVELDPFFDFSSATIPYTPISDNILQFDLGVLGLNEQISFRIYFNLSCDAELGAEHCMIGTLEDDDMCTNSLTTLIVTECQENIGSYDPNDKRIFNEAGEEVEIIDKDEYIYYHIRFQNTGTDTAFTVKVVDPLSPILDISTFVMLSSSHPNKFEITDGPALEVNFENILLPDSTTNEIESHGFFKFKIKPLPEYDYGTSIPNQAAIYFDFNEAVLTNEAVLLIEEPTNVRTTRDLIDFEVFPNPTDGELSLMISKQDLSRVSTYEVTNHLGQLLFQKSNVLNSQEFKVGHLTSGIYYLLLKEDGQVIGVERFIKI